MRHPARLLWLLLAAATPLPASSGAGQGGSPERMEPPRAAVVAPETACSPVEIPEPLLAGARVLLFGDFHGTAEIPAFFSDLACAAFRRAPHLIIALEIPAEEQARVDRYLDSSGSEAERAALLAGDFWRDTYQDGRRSRAMEALLERLRTLRQGGRGLEPPRRLDVVLLDARAAAAAGDRDRTMARVVLDAVAPGANRGEPPLVLALVGNLHTRTVRGSPWDPSFVPMGSHLVGSLGEHGVRSLDVAHLGGTAWFCTGADPASCGEKPLGGLAEPPAAVLRLFPQADEKGFHGTFFVGRLTASPPAVGTGAGAILPPHAPPPASAP